MYYTIEIAGLTRKLPLCPVSDTMNIGAFIMFGDVELTVRCAEELLKMAPSFDVIVTAEAKGIPLAFEMARQAGNKDYVVLRKEPKLYMRDVISTAVNSITTDHLQTLYIGGDGADLLRGRRVLVMDDVISTGESLRSMETLVEQTGGKIIGRAAVLAEGDAANRKDILFLQRLPLFDKNGKPL